MRSCFSLAKYVFIFFIASLLKVFLFACVLSQLKRLSPVEHWISCCSLFRDPRCFAMVTT